MTKPAPTVGITFASLQALGIGAAVPVARKAEAMGYDQFWTAEVNGVEAFSLLSAVANTTSMGVGTGVLALQLRTPPLAAMAAATLQAMVPDRDVVLGVGISSPVVSGRWHGAGYTDRPLAQTREYVQLVKACLSGEKVDFSGDFYEIKGFRLGVRLGDRKPKVVVGALNEGMLKLAGKYADGVLLNYLPATHVPWSVEQVRKGGDATIYGYVHVGVCERDDGIEAARRDLWSYATVDSYARNFSLAGYGGAVTDVRAKHKAGDRDAAIAAISDAMVDGINIMGDDSHITQMVRSYTDNGVEVPVIFPLPYGQDRMAVVERTLTAAIGAA